MREIKLCVKILQQPAGARDWLVDITRYRELKEQFAI